VRRSLGFRELSCRLVSSKMDQKPKGGCISLDVDACLFLMVLEACLMDLR